MARQRSNEPHPDTTIWWSLTSAWNGSAAWTCCAPFPRRPQARPSSSSPHSATSPAPWKPSDTAPTTMSPSPSTWKSCARPWDARWNADACPPRRLPHRKRAQNERRWPRSKARARACSRSTSWSHGWPPRPPPFSWSENRGPARNWWRAPSTAARHALASRLCP